MWVTSLMSWGPGQNELNRGNWGGLLGSGTPLPASLTDESQLGTKLEEEIAELLGAVLFHLGKSYLKMKPI